MSDTFRTRIPTLPDSELWGYLQNYSKYKFEAIEAAVIELRKRGHNISSNELQAIREKTHQRSAARGRQFSRKHLQCISAAILIAGLGSSIIIYLTAKPVSQDPLGYDSMNTKKYLRELKAFGGQANVLATEFGQWFHDLWHGRSLAFTVALLALILSFTFWFAARHQPSDPDASKGPNKTNS